MVSELKQRSRQIKEKKLLNKDEVYHGALEDILLGKLERKIVFNPFILYSSILNKFHMLESSIIADNLCKQFGPRSGQVKRSSLIWIQLKYLSFYVLGQTLSAPAFALASR